MTPDPPFRSIAIAGLGLIGGSIALGVREHWPEMRVVGVDSAAVLAHALGIGAIEHGFERLGHAPETELVILAAPVQQNVQLLQELPARAGMIVSDVGGTKRAIVSAAAALPDVLAFVGGHPLGGAERGGLAFARADLFTGRPWIFTPGDGRDNSALARDAVARLSRFTSGLGARPTTMTPEAHDRLMAYVSHLPQLTASALMEIVGSAATADGLRMAGKGLFDTTRLASSPPDVWRDICSTNADAIGAALDDLIARLTELRADLTRGDAVEAIFDEAARWRAELVKPGTDKPAT